MGSGDGGAGEFILPLGRPGVNGGRIGHDPALTPGDLHASRAVAYGGVAKWKGKGLQSLDSPVRIRSPPLLISRRSFRVVFFCRPGLAAGIFIFKSQFLMLWKSGM